MKCQLGQIEVDNVTMTEAVARILQMAEKAGKPQIVCTANLDHLASIRKDPKFKDVYQKADFVLADGMPLVWLSKLTNTPLKERVAGSDLFWKLGRASHDGKTSLFFLGGQPGAAEKAADNLREKYPNAQIAGCYCPPYGTIEDEEELERIHKAIRVAAPQILLVGFGSPKQEKWMARHCDTLGVPVLIGVGGSFDMAAGFVRRAPSWMQTSGLEWLYRFTQEPQRLWSRYFSSNLPFLLFLVASTLRRGIASRTYVRAS